MTALAFHAVEAGPRGRFYTGQQAAAAVGLSHERFRKVRLAWTRDRDFPAEINEPGEPVRYLADAVDRWVERRSRRVHPVADTPPQVRRLDAASAAGPVSSGAARRGRASLRAIRGDLH
ncbi:hypothetical protein [Brevundimonas sp.]|uniref:hypothetical protein n=1 Tax=Brevundimonas sp. TaxID=1871086 RepID=UPI002899F450|nr:hypothetical protein [Brevundimonas sp.]